VLSVNIVIYSIRPDIRPDIWLFSVSGIQPDIQQVKSSIQPDIQQVKSSIQPDTGYKKNYSAGYPAGWISGVYLLTIGGVDSPIFNFFLDFQHLKT
jgi:hypothetical protein